MDYEQGSLLLSNALKGFHGKFKKMYGQIALRLDGETYLTTGGTKALSDITEDYFEVCDINTGDLGEIFRYRKDINDITKVKVRLNCWMPLLMILWIVKMRSP